HPHGDMAVYNAMVRMAQDFSMRYPLINGQGNFGSMDGDPAAAMRYTEAKMSKISREILTDIKKETVDMVDTFDNTQQEPSVLPTRIPNLLLNGTDGIAVGMATKIPPHNLGEIVDALLFMLKKGQLEKKHQPEEVEIKQLSVKKVKSAEEVIMEEVNLLSNWEFEFESQVTSAELTQFVKGPDFPTRGQIFDQQAIEEVYTTGRGKIPVRGVAKIEEGRGGRFQIIISELPYQVNKADLVSKIADLAKDKKIVGISDLRDESDRQIPVRIVIELRRNAKPNSVLNKLYKYTPLQTSFPANMLALVDGVPQTLNLRQFLLLYLRHRHQIVKRAAIFDFKEAKFRSHILEGLKIALDNLDEVIETIKKSKNADVAKENLMRKFSLTDLQAVAILDMQLRRLAALEREKIEAEYKEIQLLLDRLRALLTKPEAMVKSITKELGEIKDQYADPRRTKVFARGLKDFNEEDLIPDQEVIVTVTKTGYIKRVPRDTYRSQRRGGKGVVGMTTKESDEIDHIISCTTHDYLLFFTNKGRVFDLRTWETPDGSRQSKGQAVINLINIDQGEQIQAILKRDSKPDPDAKYIFMATKNGIVKRTPLKQFANIRSSGIIAIGLRGSDELTWCQITNGKNQVFLTTKDGKCIRFAETDVRSMGRSAQGVKGIALKPGNEVVSMDIIPSKLPKPEDKRKKIYRHLLAIMENGIGKRTDVYKYPLQKRGGVGVKVANITEKTGKVASATVINENIEQVILTSKKAQIIKLPIKNIPELGRATQGVIIMRFKKGSGDHVSALACLEKSE
ncbi:MAG: DNA gyrase subunit A, partial [Patescibacteria group bacterium]